MLNRLLFMLFIFQNVSIAYNDFADAISETTSLESKIEEKEKELTIAKIQNIASILVLQTRLSENVFFVKKYKNSNLNGLENGK